MPPAPPSGSSRAARRRGRHRRHSSALPKVTTTTAVAVVVATGLNVPNALGKAGGHTAPPPARQVASAAPESTGAAIALAQAEAALRSRDILAADALVRASRAKAVRDAAALRAKIVAARQAAIARERARPKFVLPIAGARMSAGFGQSSRLWSSHHTGQDFAAGVGTPVRAVADGTIVSAGWDGPYGRKIAVQHTDGTVTWYAHLSGFERTGGEVEAGDVIGYVGSTGNSTGPHLHFEVRPGGGSPIEPVHWLREHGVRL